MLHDILSLYLESIEALIRNLKDAYVERYEEEILSSNRINLRIRVRFKTGYLFELNEASIVVADKFKRLNYRYHFQDSQNNLVFRYDNTNATVGGNAFVGTPEDPFNGAPLTPMAFGGVALTTDQVQKLLVERFGYKRIK